MADRDQPSTSAMSSGLLGRSQGSQVETDDDWVSLVSPQLTQEEWEELSSAESDTESDVEDTEARWLSRRKLCYNSTKMAREVPETYHLTHITPNYQQTNPPPHPVLLLSI